MVARVACFALTAWCITATVSRADPDLAAAKAQILTATNALRRENKLEPLAVNAMLDNAASSFADYMAKTGMYGHSVDGHEPWDRAALAGYEYCTVRENINYLLRVPAPSTDELVAKLMEGWKNSPEHLKNMLDLDIVDIGIGVAVDAEAGKYYAVQVFGRPRSLTTHFTLINESPQSVSYQVDGMPYTLVMNASMTHERCTSVPAVVRLVAADGTTGEDLRPTNDEVWVVRSGENGTPVFARK